MDKTMIIWGVKWPSEFGFDLLHVGKVVGNTLGLYGCRFGNQGTSILAHGYQGTFHLWQYDQVRHLAFMSPASGIHA